MNLAATLPINEGEVYGFVPDAKLVTYFSDNCVRHTHCRPGISASSPEVYVHEVWEIGQNLARRSGGSVRLKCLRQSDEVDNPLPQLRAVKLISKVKSDGDEADYRLELEATIKFSHPRYVPYFVQSSGWFEDDNYVYVTLEYLPLGDLHRIMKASPAFNEEDTRVIVKQLLEGVGIMHECGFIHKDLKPGNILVEKAAPEWLIKIADFGTTKRVQDHLTNRSMTSIGTFGHMAPEVLGFYQNDELAMAFPGSTDVWAIGIIAMEMLFKKLPFSSVEDIWRYVDGSTQLDFATDTPYGACTDSCQEFIEQLLSSDPAERATIRSAKIHEWLALDSTPTQDQTRLPIVPHYLAQALLDFRRRDEAPSPSPSLDWSDILREMSIWEYLTIKNPPVITPQKSKPPSSRPYSFTPMRLKTWHEFNMSTFEQIFGKQLMQEARQKRDMLEVIELGDRELHVFNDLTSDSLLQQWNMPMTKHALHAVRDTLHPTGWQSNTDRRTAAAEISNIQLPASTAMSECEICRQRDQQSPWNTDERLPKVHTSYPKFNSARILPLVNSEGYWDMKKANRHDISLIKEAYTLCVVKGCRYGCILSTHEAFIFRVSPVVELMDMDETKNADLQQVLCDQGLMEWVSVPWEIHRRDDIEDFQDLTINFSLWVLHILAGNRHEVDWQYLPLGEETLVQHSCVAMDTISK
ncbi:kinase-like protein [Paramyrothecium foliicola]|nr:kinase-like protein [Paramyrothecium foliicola]